MCARCEIKHSSSEIEKVKDAITHNDMPKPTQPDIHLSSDDESVKGRRLRDDKSRLVYKHKYGTVELHSASLECLSSGSYVKDTIVQFYLAYLLSENCPEKFADKIHIFDTIFHHQLNKIFEDKEVHGSKLKKLTRWYDGVDIFEKDFLIFPVCHDDHWTAIVVCYPWAVPPVFEGDSDDEDDGDAGEKEKGDKVTTSNLDETENQEQTQKTRTPGIIVMDSLRLKSRTASIKVRDFLDYEWRGRLKEPKRFHFYDLEEFYPVLPKQKNTFDCGVFMLMYLKTFMENPYRFYKLSRGEDSTSKQHLRLKVKKNIDQNNRDSIKKLILDVCNTQSGRS